MTRLCNIFVYSCNVFAFLYLKRCLANKGVSIYFKATQKLLENAIGTTGLNPNLQNFLKGCNCWLDSNFKINMEVIICI